MKRLLVAACLAWSSAAFGQASKVGPGAQMVPQAASPGKDTANGVYWVDSADSNRPYYTNPAGASSALMTASSSTLAATYTNGSSAANQTMSIAAADGGPVICKANAAATGASFQTQTSASAPLVSFTDNGTNSLVSAMADGASALAFKVDTTTSWTNPTAIVGQLLTNGSEKFAFYALGAQINTRNSIGTVQTAGLTLRNVTAASAGAQQYSPMVVLEGQGWKTNATAASQSVLGEIQVRPVQGAANPTGRIDFLFDINGGGALTAASISSIGDIALQGTTGVIVNDNSGIFNSANTKGIILAPSGLAAGIYGGSFGPFANHTQGSGNAMNIWSSTWSDTYSTSLGTQLTAASTITPVYGSHHVTGATVISSIATVNLFPDAAALLEFRMIADGGVITWDAAGNIAAAGTVAQDHLQIFGYDANTSKWYPN